MALQGIRRIAPGIVQDPAINSGRPIIEGTRVFVDRLIRSFPRDTSVNELACAVLKAVVQLAQLDISNRVYRLDPSGLEEEL